MRAILKVSLTVRTICIIPFLSGLIWAYDAQSQNLVSNPGFEEGVLMDWSHHAINGSVVNFSGISTDVAEGDTALKILVDIVGSGGPQVIGIRQDIKGLDHSRPHHARVAVKGPEGQKFRIRILGDVKQTKNFTVNGSGFVYYEYLLDPLEPSSDSNWLFGVEFGDKDNSAGTWFVDDISLVAGEDTSGGGDPGNLSRAFVSPEGDDGNEGTLAKPLKTVARAVELLVGDTIYLLEGAYHEETMITGLKGTSSRPVVITAYKDHKVIFDGTIPIDTPWELHEGNIYKTTLDRDIWQVFAGGEMMNLCRWPNVSGFIEDEQPLRPDPLPGSLWDQQGTWGHSASEGVENGKMVDDGTQGLASTGLDMTGAIAVLNVGSFKTSAAPVLLHGAGQDFFTWDPAMTDPWLKWQKPAHAYYFLEGKLNLLDNPGEWHYDKSTRELYLMTKGGEHPESAEIRGKVQSYSMRFESCSYVTVKDITFWGTTISGEGCTYFRIENCEFTYPSYARRILGDYSATDITLFDGSSGNLKVINNVFQFTEAEALHLKGSGHLIENNLMRHIDFTCVNLNNLGGTVNFIADNNVFLNNTIYLAGASETVTPGSNNTVEGNEVWGIGHLQNDGSMIQYMVGPSVGSVTRYNWLHDCKKSGMRYDGSLDVGNTGLPGVWDPWESQTKGQVYGNVIWNCPTGLMIKGDYHVIVNNTVLENQKVGIIMMNPKPDGANPHSITRNNIASMISGYRGGRDPDEYPIPGDHSHNWNAYYETDSIPQVIQDYANRDFRPVNTAKLVDAGSEDIHSDDLFPQHSYTGSAYDIGAYEYGDDYYNIAGRRLEKCSHPVPGDGSLSHSADVILAWRPAYRASGYDVFIGKSLSGVSGAGKQDPEYYGSQTGNVADPGPVRKGELLYWRVDAHTTQGIVQGEVWTFTAGRDANMESYNISFTISGKEGELVSLLEGASVLVGGEEILTDSAGQAEFILSDNKYTYTISAEGYLSRIDSLTVSADTALSVILEKEDPIGLQKTVWNRLRVYPVPASQSIYIDHGMEFCRIRISNLLGKTIYHGEYYEPVAEIETRDLEQGVYLISVTNNLGYGITRRIIIQHDRY